MEKAKSTMRSAEEQAELQELDDIIANMRKNTLDTPYIMSTPSDRPYRLAESEVDNWRINIPFEAHERDLQYMTFLWRDPETTLFKLDRIPLDPPANPTFLKSNGPTKKIKFDAYKNRVKLQAHGVTPAGQVSDGSKLERVKVEEQAAERLNSEAQVSASTRVEESKTHVEEHKTSNGSTQGGGSIQSSSLKNERDVSSSKVEDNSLLRDTAKKEDMPTQLDAAQCSPAQNLISNLATDGKNVKESRINMLSPAPSVHVQSAHKVKLENDHELPPWWSAPITGSVEFSMPSRLPTPPIEFPPDSKASKKSSSVNAEPQGWVPTSLNRNEKPNMDDTNDASALQMMKRKPTQNVPAWSDQGKVVVPNSAGKNPLSTSDDGVISELLGTANTKEKLIVRLKFSRARVKAVSSVLRFKSNSSSSGVSLAKNAVSTAKQPTVGNNTRKALSSTPQNDRLLNVAVTGKSIARKTVTPSRTPSTIPWMPNRDDDAAKSTSSEKRMRLIDEVAPGDTPKRSKLSESVTSSREKAPAISKNEADTPRSDRKAVNGNGAKMTTNPSTPKLISATPKKPTDVSPEANKKTKSSQAWTVESSRLSDLGRKLKHQAMHTFRSVDRANALNEKEEALWYTKLNMLERTESVLCFILAFSAASYTQTPPKGWIANWHSLLPMANENYTRSHPYRDFGGLCALLVSVCHSKIIDIYGGLKGSNIGSGDETTQHLRIILRDLEGAQRHGAEADRLLPRAVLAEKYRETSKICDSLPIGMNMTPVTAVKLALTFMKEWAAQEKIQWKQQLEQDVCLQFEARLA